MTNFDFLKLTPDFASFADVAISAERLIYIDPAACVFNCRRAMEFAVKWMYSVDGALSMPFDDSLHLLINSEDFRDIVGSDVWRRMDIIRKMGNDAAHKSRGITEEQAEVCLENLFIFLDEVAYLYSPQYEDHIFDKSLFVRGEVKPEVVAPSIPDIDFEALIRENESLKAELTARRAEQQQTYVPKPLDISEYKTRKIYLDVMLRDAGWVEGKDWLN